MAAQRRYPPITSELLEKSEKLPAPGVFKIDDYTVVKTGGGTRVAEAAALRLVPLTKFSLVQTTIKTAVPLCDWKLGQHIETLA